MEQPHESPPASLAVSLNSVRHGLRTVALVIPGHETEADWTDFSADAYAALAPEGAIESALAERVVELLWRLRRVARAEQHNVLKQLDMARKIDAARVERNVEVQREVAGSFYASTLDIEPRTISATLLPREAELNQLVRYEAHLSKQLYRAMHELEVLQAKRSGRPSPLLRLRIDGMSGE